MTRDAILAELLELEGLLQDERLNSARLLRTWGTISLSRGEHWEPHFSSAQTRRRQFRLVCQLREASADDASQPCRLVLRLASPDTEQRGAPGNRGLSGQEIS